MFASNAIGDTREAQSVKDGRRFMERSFLHQLRHLQRYWQRRQRGLLLVGLIARHEAIAHAEAKMPFTLRGCLIFEEKIAHQIDRKPAIEDVIFLKRLETKRPQLLGMQPRQRGTLE